MNVSEQDYRKVARVLDGEDLPLSPRQQDLLEQIRRDESDLGATMDVQAPPEAIQRAWKRMVTRLQAPRRRARWIVAATGVAAAAVLAISLLWQNPTPTPSTTTTATKLPEPTAEEFLQALAGEPEDEMIRETAHQVEELVFQVSLAPENAETKWIDEVDSDLLEAEKQTRELLDDLVSEIPEM